MRFVHRFEVRNIWSYIKNGFSAAEKRFNLFDIFNWIRLTWIEHLLDITKNLFFGRNRILTDDGSGSFDIVYVWDFNIAQ